GEGEEGRVPGAGYSPTEPFVSRPRAFDRQGVSLDDLIDYTPALHEEAVKLVSNYKIGPIFTPPVVSTWPKPLATLIMPSATGGANWQGGSLDPQTNIMYIFSNTSPTQLGLVPADPARTDFGYIQGTARDPNAPAPAGRGGGGGGAPSGEAAAAGGRGGRGGAGGAAPAAAAAGGGGGEGGGGGLTVQGLPIVKPPYARITALDLNKGEMVWQIAHGE